MTKKKWILLGEAEDWISEWSDSSVQSVAHLFDLTGYMIDRGEIFGGIDRLDKYAKGEARLGSMCDFQLMIETLPGASATRNLVHDDTPGLTGYWTEIHLGCSESKAFYAILSELEQRLTSYLDKEEGSEKQQ